jgi:hypothetical protein
LRGVNAAERSPDLFKLVFKGGPVELEQVASSDPPLAIDCLYRDRDRQFRRHGIGATSSVGGLRAVAAARLAPVHRSVHVRATLCRQLAERAKAGETGVKKSGSQHSKSPSQKSPSQLIDARIKELGDWRGETLARVRSLIKEACPDVVEEWKWRGVPVWEHAGIICTGETYKAVVKLTFANGALLEDPLGLFNSSLDGNVRRAIDIHEGDKLNERALKNLVGAAVDHNQNKLRKKAPAATGAKLPKRK